MANVSIGVIGLGFMGSRWARYVYQHPSATLAVVSDVREELGRDLANQMGARFVRDADEAAADSALDGVVVCTPEHLHIGPALAAIDAGKPLAVEKPLAHTLADAERLRDRAAERRVPVLVGHILRFEPRYAGVGRSIADGEIGAVQAFHSKRIGLAETQDILQGRTSIGLYLGVHEFDLARWYVGDLATIGAHMSAGVVARRGHEVADLYSALLGFESGAHGTTMIGWSIPDSYPGRGVLELTVIGEHRLLSVSQDHEGFLKVAADGPRHEDFFFTTEIEGQVHGVMAIEVDHFVRCVQGSTQPACTAADGTEAIRASLAMEKAAETGLIETL